MQHPDEVIGPAPEMGAPAEEDDPAVRPARPEDFDTIVAVLDTWWGRPVSDGFTRLFLDHFSGTSLVAESGGELAGFVVGFLSPAKPREAYIHFTGVAPQWRRTGLARALYERFFQLARDDGRTVVKAITSPQNTGSIAFHQAMGFAASDPVKDYDGPSRDRVVFVRSLQAR
jgi:ribosomal protein S18 acetylase RimI-like enzyme